jgi:hypothetical protein
MGIEPALTAPETEPAPIARSRTLRKADWVAIASLAMVVINALTVDIGFAWARSGGPFDGFSILWNLLPVTGIGGLVTGLVALANRPPGALKWPCVLVITLSPIVAFVGFVEGLAIVWSGLP